MPEASPSAEDAPKRLRGGLLSRVALLGTATILIKLVALAKDLFVAQQLGAGDALDAYLVALVLPSYAAVVLGHTFASAFVPTYVRVWRREGLIQAQQLAGGVLASALVILSLISSVVVLVAPWLLPVVGSGFDTEKLALTLRLFYPMVAIVVASGIAAVLAAILNAHERFAAVAVAPIAIPIASLGALWIGRQDGVHALALGTAIGFVAEAAIITLAAWSSGLLPMPTWPGRAPEVNRVGRQYLPVVTGGLLMSSAMVIDQTMAASLGTGQVSILNFAGKVVAVVLTIVAASISTALFPRFTHQIVAGQFPEFRRMLVAYTTGIVLLSLPGMLMLGYFSEPLVRLLFERGAFDDEATRAVAQVQLWLIPQIPFYVLALLGGRVLSALDGNLAVMRIALLNVVVNVSGNLILMQWFGVRGIAMATSLMYVLASAATFVAIRTRLSIRQDGWAERNSTR